MYISTFLTKKKKNTKKILSSQGIYKIVIKIFENVV